MVGFIAACRPFSIAINPLFSSEVGQLLAKAALHQIIPGRGLHQSLKRRDGPAPSVDACAGSHQVIDRFIDVDRAWFIATARQQMPDGVQSDFGGEGRLLDREIAGGADECGRCRLMIGCTVEGDVEISCGFGRGEPFALANVERDQVFQ